MSQTYTGLEVIDRDYYFVVDASTREISSKKPQKTILVRNDHNSERFTFEVPRFIEGRDLTLCNTVRVYYRNGRQTGVYTVEDVEPYQFMNDTIVCSWLISQNATSYVGPLSFMLKFSQVDEEGNVEYSWSTKTYDGAEIVGDIEAPDVFESTYVDMIEQMKSLVITELTDNLFSHICSRGTKIESNSDLDDYIVPGVYYITYGDNGAATLQNAPTTTSGFKLYVEHGNQHGAQNIIHIFQTARATSGTIYQRVYRNNVTDNNGWSNWSIIHAPSNVATVSN